MPNRRVFGSVFRKRRPLHKRGGALPEFHPGWYVRVRRNGVDMIRYGGADRGTALAYIRKLQSDIEKRELLGEIPQIELTFAEFGEQYLSHCERMSTHDTYASRRSTVRGVLVKHFGPMALQKIQRPDIERFLDSKKKWQPGTRNRYLSILAVFYKRAIALGYLATNPTAGIQRAKEPRLPLPLVSLEDQDRLIANMPEHIWLLAVVALDTGMRLGELLRLEWADLDLDGGVIVVKKSKTHRPRVVRMSARLRAALAAVGRPPKGQEEQRLFPDLIGEDGRFKAQAFLDYKAACAKTGYPLLRFHDLRHLNAINLVRGGLDLPAIQAHLGHASLQSTLRYAEYADETASSRAAAVLDRLREPRPPH